MRSTASDSHLRLRLRACRHGIQDSDGLPKPFSRLGVSVRDPLIYAVPPLEPVSVKRLGRANASSGCVRVAARCAEALAASSKRGTSLAYSIPNGGDSEPVTPTCQSRDCYSCGRDGKFPLLDAMCARHAVGDARIFGADHRLRTCHVSRHTRMVRRGSPNPSGALANLACKKQGSQRIAAKT
jgi:hypothetical protein